MLYFIKKKYFIKRGDILFKCFFIPNLIIIIIITFRERNFFFFDSFAAVFIYLSLYNIVKNWNNNFTCFKHMFLLPHVTILYRRYLFIMFFFFTYFPLRLKFLLVKSFSPFYHSCTNLYAKFGFFFSLLFGNGIK